MKIFNCCIPSLVQAQNSQVANTVEHIIVVRRPIITLNNNIRFLLFLLVLSVLRVFLGCVIYLRLNFVFHLIIEGIGTLWLYVLYNYKSLPMIIFEL
jgi:hypothetical protein